MTTTVMPDQGKVTVGRCFMACLIAGFAVSPLATMLWPLVGAIYSGGLIEESKVALAGLVAVASLSLVGGLALALLVGFPLLVGAERLGVNQLPVLAAAGAITSLVIGLAGSWPKEAWVLYLFIGVLGASCGAIASRASRPRGNARVGKERRNS